MRAIEISKPGGPEVLHEVTRPRPEPGPGEVLIEIAYAGVNRPDCFQRAGAYAPPPGASDLPGLECAGRIVALGAGVTSCTLGDQVCALLPGGGYAEFACTPAAHCLPVPPNLSLKEAASLPETFFTVWSNVFMRGKLSEGERFLVHGGASGIGTTAIQLAHAFGARVFATAGTVAKCAVCTDLGAERAINYREEDFAEIIQATGGADVVLDMVGGDYIARNIASLAPDGRLVQIAFLQGASAKLNVGAIMRNRLTLTGSTLRPQSVEAKAEIARQLRAHVWPLIEAGRVKPVMDESFALADAAKAHARMERGDHIGKIVLEVSV